MQFEWVEVPSAAVDRKWSLMIPGKVFPFAQVFWYGPGCGALCKPRYEAGLFPDILSKSKRFNNLPAAKRYVENIYYSRLFN